MNIKYQDKLINDSEKTTYILVAFLVVTVAIGSLKILFF